MYGYRLLNIALLAFGGIVCMLPYAFLLALYRIIGQQIDRSQSGNPKEFGGLAARRVQIKWAVVGIGVAVGIFEAALIVYVLRNFGLK